METIIKESSEELLLAAQKTFETITFASLESADQYDTVIEKIDDKKLFHSSIDISFADKTHYKMEIALETNYLSTLIKSVNPSIEKVDEGYLVDLSGELINTLAGNFMLQIESKVGDFKLGLPVAQQGIALSEMPVIEQTYVVDDVNPVYLGIYKSN